MRVVIQRTTKAEVKVDNKIVGQINKGLVLLVAFKVGDTSKDIDYMVNKIINLRIFDDQKGLMNLSLKDVAGSILSISQFTLYADTRKGRRPSFTDSLSFEEAKILYQQFNNKLKGAGIKVEEGIFGGLMEVTLTNEGPITIIIDSKYLS